MPEIDTGELGFCLRVSIAQQKLQVLSAEKVVAAYSVSTAKNGAGERFGSECTPRGWHQVRACIGAGQPEGAVFVGRRPTGEVFSPALAEQFPHRDWILTRILWLSGLEPGKNRFGVVDSMRRYIYIHGTPDSEPMGVPLSHGCIRMRNRDLIDLFGRISSGCKVLIAER